MTLKGALASRLTRPVVVVADQHRVVDGEAAVGRHRQLRDRQHIGRNPRRSIAGRVERRPIRAAPAGPRRKPYRNHRQTCRRATRRQPLSGHEMPCLTSNELTRTGFRLIKISDVNRGGGKPPTIRQSIKTIIRKHSPNMQANGLFFAPGRFKDTLRRTGAPICSHRQAVSVGWVKGAHRACSLSVNLCPARSGFPIDGHMPFYRFIGKATSVRKLLRQKWIVQQKTVTGQKKRST